MKLVIKTSHIVASVLLLATALGISSQFFSIRYRENLNLSGESEALRISESSINAKHSVSTGGAKTQQTRPTSPESSPAGLSAVSNATFRSVPAGTAVQSEVNARGIVDAENPVHRPLISDRGDTIDGDGTARVDDAGLTFGSSIAAGSIASGSSGDAGGTDGSELIIPVPPGEKVPALFLDESPRPVPQQKMLDRVAAEFNEAVSNPPPGVSVEEAWDQARLNADEKYLKLFGYAAYNAYHLQAAKEAVREKKSLQSVQPPEP